MSILCMNESYPMTESIYTSCVINEFRDLNSGALIF